MSHRRLSAWSGVLPVLAVLFSPLSETAAEELTFTTSSERAESFFRAGTQLYNNLYTEAAAEQFEKAIEIDPRFAMAYLYLSRVAEGYAGYRENLDIAVSLKSEVSSAEQLIIESYEARDENRLDDEIRLLRRLEALYPSDVETHYHLGEVAFSNGDYHTAVRELENAITIDDEFPPAYNLLGYTYAFLGDFDAAISTLKAYASLIPDEPNPHDSLGEIYLMAGRFDDSLQKYADALDIDPGFYSAHGGRGHAFLWMGDIEQAIAEYERMADVAPNDTVRRDARRWVGIAHLYQGHTDETTTALREVMHAALEADEVLGACNRALDIGWVQTLGGEHGSARSQLEQGWKTMMGSPLPESVKKSYAQRYHVISGVNAAQSGDLPRARAEAQKIRRLVETSADLNDWQDYNWLMGEILVHEDETTAAIANLLNASNENSRVLYLLGVAHEARGDRDQARRYFDKVSNFNRPSLLYAMTRRSAESGMN